MQVWRLLVPSGAVLLCSRFVASKLHMLIVHDRNASLLKILSELQLRHLNIELEISAIILSLGNNL